MDQRLSLITLGVQDLDRSGQFYARLGWKKSGRSTDGILFFQLNGLALALYPREELSADANVQQIAVGFGGISLAQNVHSRTDVDAVLAEAVAAGATLLKPAIETFWGGYSGYFADPDGYPWEIAWNPFFILSEAGNLVLPD